MVNGAFRCHTLPFSSFDEWELLSSCHVQASHFSGFSCCRARPLEGVGLSSCGAHA